MYKFHLFTIRALSNMHVGSGDTNFGVVDKLVQRDPATNFPYISSSSLKGALREHCEASGFKDVDYVFGADARFDNESKPGAYKFFSAYLLSIPVRSDIRPYFNGLCQAVYEGFKESLISFKIDYQLEHKFDNVTQDRVKVYIGVTDGSTVEGYTAVSANTSLNSNFTKIFGEYPAIFNDKTFCEDIASNLPVVARNHLENGISQNLWYEEIVPRETRFYFILGVPQNDDVFQTFKECITGSPVQIGANASIGYGFCEINHIGG